MAISKITETLANLGSVTPVNASTLAVLEGDVVVFVLKIRESGVGINNFVSFVAAPGSTAAIGTVTTPVQSINTVASRAAIFVGYAKVTASGDLVPRVNTNGGRTGVFGASVWRSTDALTPVPDFDVLRSDTTTTTNAIGAPVTPTAAGDVVLSFTGIQGGATTYTPTASPAFTQVWAVTGDISSLLEYYTVPSTADVTANPTLSTAQNYATATIVLKAAAAPILGKTISRLALL